MTSLTFTVGQVVELKVESLTNQGAGVGRVGGFVVFIDYTSPGDLVRVKISQVKKNFARARLIEVLEAGPDRCEPKCPVFTNCGGCDWQHIRYPRQLAEKKKIITDALGKLAKLENWPDFEVQPSPLEYGYRNRIQLHVKNGEVGYHAKGSHRLVAIQGCDIADPRISEFLPHLEKKRDRRLELRLNNESIDVLTAEEEAGFRQVNDQQNLALIRQVEQLVGQEKPAVFLDLFCGRGNFSLPLAKRFPDLQIIGSDLNDRSILEAQNAAKAEALNNVHFYSEDSLLTLRRELLRSVASMILIDPPRGGCTPAILQALNQLPAESMIYISCNPATFGRDFAWLRESHNWRISSLAAFDMFPQTPHVEIVSHLIR